MADKTFDDALDDAVHAVLARFGQRADHMVETAETLNDAFSDILSNVVEEDDTFPGVDGKRDLEDFDPDEMDEAVDDATHHVLNAFGLDADRNTDTADLINDQISEIVGRAVAEPEDDGSDFMQDYD